MPSSSSTSPAAYVTVRVFVSSTFRDMQAERDHLVRFVFPRLRERLLDQRIHLLDVDLRWGVTSDQDARDVCREIVDECRPRFICILGGRYGWIPPGSAHSITAEEVHYAVLDRPEPDRGFAYFYFRDDEATAAMIEGEPGEFKEPADSENGYKLAALKAAIVAAGLVPVTYTAQWDGDSRRLIGLEPFGNRVYEDLLRSIEADPSLRERFLSETATPIDEFDEENAAMDAFARERGESFVLGSRAPVLDALRAHTTSGTGYLLLTGAAGSGKSALLAYLSERAGLRTDASILLIRHFVGASPRSTDPHRTLRRLYHELAAAQSDLASHVPEDPTALAVVFAKLLQQACARQPVVILLDAVNQLVSTLHARLLHWLPEQLPVHARIVVSAVDGPALDEMRRKMPRPREVELRPLTAADGEAIVEQFRQRYHKALEPDQRAALLAKTDADTPLYLIAALEELRTLGTRDETSRRIAEVPSTTRDLFGWILSRLENDEGFRDSEGRRVGGTIIPRFAALLSASRYGLSQRELCDLVDPGDRRGNVAALLRFLQPYLMRRGNLLAFFHDQLRGAIESTWLKTTEEREVAHEALADYFDRQPLSMRRVSELPWQLARAQRWVRLSDTLRDLTFLSAAWRANRFEVGQYWAEIERHSHRRLADAFRNLVDSPINEDNADHVWNAARLLEESSHADEALALWRTLIAYGRRAGDPRRLAGALGNAAIRLKDIGQLESAMDFLREQERLCRALGDDYGLQNSLGNQGLIAARQRKHQQAMGLHKAKEEICRRIGHPSGVAAALGNQALLLTRSDPTAALALHHEEQRLCSAIADLQGIARSLRNQALIHEDLKNFDQAMQLFVQSERMSADIGDRLERARCLVDQSRLLERDSAGAPPHALEKLEQAKAIYQAIGERRVVAHCLLGESRIHITLAQPHEALACLDEAQDIYREQGDANGMEACVLNRAVVILGWQEQMGLELLVDQEARLRTAANEHYLVQCLLTQVPVLMRQHRLREAMAKCIESERLCRTQGDGRRLALCLEYQSRLRELGDASAT